MARTTTALTTRRAATRPPERPAGRPMVRSVGAGGGPLEVVFDVRTVWDFMISLSDEAGATDDLPERDREWLLAARTALPALARRDREDLLAKEAFLGAVVVAVGRPDVRTASDLVAALRTTDPKDLARRLMLDAAPQPELTPLVEAALGGDVSVLPRIEDAIKTHCDAEECALRLDLLRQPDEYHHRLVNLLAAWAERFAAVEERVGTMIRHDADDRTVDRRTLAPLDLIERTTGGIRLIPEAGVSRVILAPSYFARPYNYTFRGDGWWLFCYPLADSALDVSDPLAPPAPLVRLHRALGDETRLRILKLLSGRDLYLTELAQELKLSKPTVKHHLVLLRTAGLVTVMEGGPLIYYSLRRDRLEEATRDIAHFLSA